MAPFLSLSPIPKLTWNLHFFTKSSAYGLHPFLYTSLNRVFRVLQIVRFLSEPRHFIKDFVRTSRVERPDAGEPSLSKKRFTHLAPGFALLTATVYYYILTF